MNHFYSITEIGPLVAHTFDSQRTGPNLVVLGAVHGNEPCGPIAISRIIEEFKSDSFKLLKGKIIFVPVCNPSAYEQNIRFTDIDLNRIFAPTYMFQGHYEETLVTPIKTMLDSADYVVDIHSYQIGGAPFAFFGNKNGVHNPATLLFMLDLLRFDQNLSKDLHGQGLTEANYVTGHSDLLRKAGRSASMGTTEHARHNSTHHGQGAVGITVECGQHEATFAPEVGYQAICNALSSLGMISPIDQPPSPKALEKYVDLSDEQAKVIFKEGRDTFVEPWANFQFIKARTELVRRENGHIERAPCDGMIVLPKKNSTPGEAMLYLGPMKPLAELRM